MRPIKFRAWNTVIAQIGSALPLRVWTDDIAQRPETYHANINNLVLMQFTGLKDKNGKEIYEGDIVQFDEQRTSVVESHVAKATVFYAEQIASYALDYGHTDRLDDPIAALGADIFEVIGNIYENPELLK